MKPKETLLHLFHFICGGFLEQKATEYECLLMWQIEIMLDLPALTSCSWHVYNMASKCKRAFSRILKELDLSPLANTRFRGSWVILNRESAPVQCSLKPDASRAIHEIRVCACTTCRDTTQIDTNLVLGRAPRFAARIRTEAAKSRKNSKSSPHTNLNLPKKKREKRELRWS